MKKKRGNVETSDFYKRVWFLRIEKRIRFGNDWERKKRRAYTGIEPVTSRTLSENHTTRPAGQLQTEFMMIF